MNVASFDSTKRPIEEMLRDAGAGKIQLPDFQRGWVWDDHHIRDLIASVSLSFPIGAVMILEAGGEDVRFKTRPIEGAEPLAAETSPETLILDGQQRLTSLFQSLKSGKVVATRDTRDKCINRWYYLDMKKCVGSETDREDAVVAVPEHKVLRTFRGETILDLSSCEKEYENDMFPLSKIFLADDWQQGYLDYWELDRAKWDLYKMFNARVIKRFEQYQVPVIQLDRETPKEAVCLVFEKVNTGGEPLTVFELLTASFAADDFLLREDWDFRKAKLDAQPILTNMENTAFLQAVTLLASKFRGTISCRRRDILRLTKDQYVEWAPRVEDGFRKASQFLREQKVFRSSDIPYRTQLVPLAAILADLGSAGDTDGARQKIARWFWCGVLGEMYGGTTETRLGLDLADVTDWVRGGLEEPRTIRDANFQADRLLTLRTRNSAGYKGVHALLMRDGSLDFRKGQPLQEQTVNDENIDIHHIFPRLWCQTPKNSIASDLFDSIVNKTAIDAKTNRIIGGNAPSKYLPRLEKIGEMTTDRMDEILRTHRIPVSELRSDDFWGFFKERAERLLECIESVMCKNIEGREQLFQSIESKNSRGTLS